MTLDVNRLRRDLAAALPAYVAQEGEELSAAQLYMPWSHTRALRLESALVIGARGVGKSVWSQALQDPDLTEELFPYPLRVSPGFGVALRPDSYPDPDTFEALVAQHECQPYQIWRAA